MIDVLVVVRPNAGYLNEAVLLVRSCVGWKPKGLAWGGIERLNRLRQHWRQVVLARKTQVTWPAMIKIEGEEYVNKERTRGKRRSWWRRANPRAVHVGIEFLF